MELKRTEKQIISNMSYCDKLFNLKGKSALITGTSSGIGQAISVGFAHAGAKICGIYNKTSCAETSRLIEGSGQRFVSLQADIGKMSESDFSDLFFKAEELLSSKISILVNCAGINLRNYIPYFTESDWDAVLATNLKAVFALSQTFARIQIDRESKAQIINIGSLLSQRGGCRTAAYTASKHAVLGTTRLMANELGKYGIRVNCIAPGYIRTKMTQEYISNTISKPCLERIPLQRWGEVDDIVGCAIFLASKASRYITGEVLYVDGGYQNT